MLGNVGSRWARVGSLLPLIGVVCVVAACGSSDDGGTTSSAGSTTSGEASVDVDKEWAPGVPTLAELYASTETEPPSSGPPAAKDKSVVFVSCGQAAPGCAGPPNEMKNAAAALGWKYQIVDGQLNANNGYATAIRQALALKPDALVVHGIGCSEAKQSFLEAKAQKVPVLAIQSADCDDPLNPGGPGEGLFEPLQFNDGAKTASDFFAQWGRLQAAYVVNATQGKAQVIRTLQPGQVFAQHLAAGQSEILEKCADCEILDEVKLVPQDAAAGGPGVQKFTTMLARYPNANAAIFNYDGTAVSGGFAKAVADAGRAESMVTVAGEGYAPALQLIREGGGLTADPAHSGKWLAWGAADSLNRLFNDEPLVPQGIGFRLVDKDNNLPTGSGDYEPPIDYRSIYKKSWGVQ